MSVFRVGFFTSVKGTICLPCSFLSSFARQVADFDGPPPRHPSSPLRPLSNPDWNSVQLPPIKKQSFSPLVDHTDERVQQWRDKHKVRVQYGHTVPAPLLSFGEYRWPGSISEHLESRGISVPTPVQAQGCPIVLSGADMVGIAQTGSGKTLAYTLPAIMHLIAQEHVSRGATPCVLVLAPTRELVQQIQSVIVDYTRCLTSQLRTVCLYGGASRNKQFEQLSRGCDIAIATPGRLIDFMQSNTVSLRRCSFLVLDEADRMLDMGFKPQITDIATQIRPDRQTVMWSATWPKEVRSLSTEFMLDDHALLSVGAAEDGLVANADITQHVHVCNSNNDKLPRLLQLLSPDRAHPTSAASGVPRRVLVFAATRRRCDWLLRMLSECVPARRPVVVHGQCTQAKRDSALALFRQGRSSVLIATDVAARGLDISDVDAVINFDHPNNSADYIHRIGRTGRCGRAGTAHSLITDEDSGQMAGLIDILQSTGQHVPEEVRNMARMSAPQRRAFHQGGNRRSGDFSRDRRQRDYSQGRGYRQRDSSRGRDYRQRGYSSLDDPEEDRFDKW